MVSYTSADWPRTSVAGTMRRTCALSAFQPESNLGVFSAGDDAQCGGPYQEACDPPLDKINGRVRDVSECEAKSTEALSDSDNDLVWEYQNRTVRPAMHAHEASGDRITSGCED